MHGVRTGVQYDIPTLTDSERSDHLAQLSFHPIPDHCTAQCSSCGKPEPAHRRSGPEHPEYYKFAPPRLAVPVNYGKLASMLEALGPADAHGSQHALVARTLDA